MSDDVHLTGTVTVPNNWRESSANSDQRMMEMQTYT